MLRYKLNIGVKVLFTHTRRYRLSALVSRHSLARIIKFIYFEAANSCPAALTRAAYCPSIRRKVSGFSFFRSEDDDDDGDDDEDGDGDGKTTRYIHTQPTTIHFSSSSRLIFILPSRYIIQFHLLAQLSSRSQIRQPICTMTSGDSYSISGLSISVTESIHSFLLPASKDPTLSQELQEAASDLSSQSKVPYKKIRSIWLSTSSDTRPDLLQLFSASDFVFSRPKPREKSEELKARLRKLADLAERREYQELVKDIAPKKDVVEPFSSYKDQLGFGEQNGAIH